MSPLSPSVLLKFKPATPNHHCKPNPRPLAATLITLAYTIALVCSSLLACHGQLAGAAALAPSAAQMASDVIAIKEGADLDLSCPIVVQNEDMIISWTCDNEPANIKSSRIHVTESGKLRIRSAKVGDSCNYRCEAADGFGTLSMLIKVIIVDKNLMEKLNRGKSPTAGTIAGPGAFANQTFAPGNSNQQAATAVATRWRTAAQATSSPPAAGEAHLSELSTSAATATSAVNEKIINDQVNHLRAHNAGSISAMLDPPEAARGSGGSDQADDLQVQVDNMRTYVQVNKTFSLECQVKYGHQRVPQIIWLKEFIGRQPESLTEAHDQNLILIDNIYYHSLNWPRSLSYSRETSSANSALLIRQAKPIHSGRYICLAGYQPSLIHNSASLSSMKMNNNDNRASLVSSIAQKASLKYKMDMTIVEVQDQARPSENDITQAGGSSTFHEVPSGYATNGAGSNTGWPSGNLLISIFLSNSLTRNLTLLIILLIGLLLLLKLVVYPYYKLSRTTNGKANNNNNNNNNTTTSPQASQQTNFLAAQLQRPQDATALTVIKTIGASNYGNSLQAAPLPKLPPKQLHLDEKAVVGLNQRNEADQAINDGNAVEPRTGKSQSRDQCNKQFWLGDNHCKNDDADDGYHDDKHLYSEIGERYNKAPNSQLTAEEVASESDANSSESNNIYKVPNKLISKIN